MAPTSGSQSKTGETLAEAGETVATEPTDAALCMDDCLFECSYQKQDLIRCANCTTWVHVKCISRREEYVPVFWACFQCRKMPVQISELTAGMVDVLSTLKTLTKSLDKLHREQSKMKSELKDKDDKITELIKENTELKNRISSMAQSDNALHWQGLSPVQPQNSNTLLIGSSIIRDVDENKLLNTKCICIPGGNVSDVKEAIAKFPTTNKMRRIALVSGNDCEGGKNSSLTPTTDILSKYEELIKCATEVSSSVVVSSVCPRSLGDNVEDTRVKRRPKGGMWRPWRWICRQWSIISPSRWDYKWWVLVIGQCTSLARSHQQVSKQLEAATAPRWDKHPSCES